MSPINWADGSVQPVGTSVLQVRHVEGTSTATYTQGKKAYPNNWSVICGVTLIRRSSTSVFHFKIGLSTSANKNNNITCTPVLRLTFGANANPDDDTSIGGPWYGWPAHYNTYDSADFVHQQTHTPNEVKGQNVTYKMQLQSSPTGDTRYLCSSGAGSYGSWTTPPFMTVFEVDNDDP